jgi:prophage tail gpP-like protein
MPGNGMPWRLYRTVLKVADPVELEIQVTLPYGTDANKLVRGQKVLVNVAGETWVDGYIHQIAMSDEGTPASTTNRWCRSGWRIQRKLEFDSLVKVTF